MAQLKLRAFDEAKLGNSRTFALSTDSKANVAH
jgi:hypothetical protein